MKKILLVLIALLLVACSNSQESDTNVLKIATSSGYPPYEMIDPINNKLIGFDIDFGELIAQELGMEVDWMDMSFDGVIASLSANTADMAIAGLSPDPSRDALFSDAYYNSAESPFYIVTKNDSGINETKDIYGRKVGVQIATIQESAAKELMDGYELILDTRDAYNVMVQELLIGRIHFLIMEPLVAQEYLDEYEELVMFELEAPELDNLSGNAVAIPKNNEELLKKINTAIQKLKDDGRLDELIDTWFNK